MAKKNFMVDLATSSTREVSEEIVTTAAPEKEEALDLDKLKKHLGRTGRPKKDEADRKKIRVPLQLTQDMYDKLKAAAKDDIAADGSMNKYITMLLDNALKERD